MEGIEVLIVKDDGFFSDRLLKIGSATPPSQAPLLASGNISLEAGGPRAGITANSLLFF